MPIYSTLVFSTGSSPRMRGTHDWLLDMMCWSRIIPAYAGNTRSRSPRRTRVGDHPRVCGEHFFDLSGDGSDTGSSPRMRGTHARRLGRPAGGGIIPAYAGNTSKATRLCRGRRDHPRVCGEHRIVRVRVTAISGSSPRMRGTPVCSTCTPRNTGIIPAYAGNTRALPIAGASDWDHPRVCGEHITTLPVRMPAAGSSPRMRGTRGATLVGSGCRGIIPAYAGNTLRDYSNFVVSKFMSFVFHLV